MALKTAVGASGSAPPSLEAAEYAFNEVALLVESNVILEGSFLVSPGGTGSDGAAGRSVTEVVALRARGSDQDIQIRQGRQQRGSTAIVTDLPSGE